MSTDRPNFVFILTDDQGWEDLGCFGHSACFGRFPIKTPVLDKLARRRGYAPLVCRSAAARIAPNHV